MSHNEGCGCLVMVVFLVMVGLITIGLVDLGLIAPERIGR